MIIIIDDTFDKRHLYNDIGFLEIKQYKDICKIYHKITNFDLNKLIDEVKQCNLFCIHKTLQIYNINKTPLNDKDNTEIKKSLISKVLSLNIPKIEFSRDLNTNFDAKTIDKYVFYSNLKLFLDYFIENNNIELKILFWGQNFKEKEMLSIIQNMLMQIRMTDIKYFHNNNIIEKGVEILYPQNTFKETINEWKSSQLSKNEIIKEINNHIK
ncbi:MAG: hypothetical protein U9N54_09550 [candidate division Zixibacteria bacterium]|nr:hypothetical protein [candidate division Zixibacteria bacterium]